MNMSQNVPREAVPKHDSLNSTPAIVVRDLQMHFRGCDALRGVNLNVKPGTVFALLGENGDPVRVGEHLR